MSADQREITAQDGALTRRGLLLGVAGVVGAAGGTAFGYKEDELLAGWRQRLLGRHQTPPPGSASFRSDAARIRAAQEHQTLQEIKDLKRKYQDPIFGRVRVWDMIEKLALCVDPTDDALLLTSQYIHVQQVLERMERDKIHDRDLILTALLHDLGKVMLLTAEVPEHIVCFTKPVGEYPHRIGLDNVILQFGHD